MFLIVQMHVQSMNCIAGLDSFIHYIFFNRFILLFISLLVTNYIAIVLSTNTLSFTLSCFYTLPYIFVYNFIHFLFAFTCSFLKCLLYR